MDPFVQQIIGIGEQQFPSNSTAIAKALRYSRGTILPVSEAFAIGADNRTYSLIITNTDFSLQSAILFGLSNPSITITQQTTKRCPGAHCVWEPFLSLGVCSTCVDITNMLTQNTNHVTQMPQQNSLALTLNPGLGTSLAGPEIVTFNLSNGLYLEYDFPIVSMVSYGTSNRSQTVAFQDNRLLLYSMSVIKYLKDGGPIPGIPMIATECSLQYCINNYTSEMINGTLSEMVKPVPGIAIPPAWEQELESWGPIRTPGTLQTDLVQYIDVAHTVDLPDLQLGNKFNISQAAINSIAGGLSSVFTQARIAGCTGFYIDDTGYSPNSMQLIHDSKDLNTTFANLAMSISNSMRSNDDNGTLVQGTVSITVYKVRLKWMSLPIIIVFGGFVLLALTILYTHFRGLPIWKSSSLSVLKIGEISTNRFDSESVGGMERKAKRTFVRLFHDSSDTIGEEEEVSRQDLRSPSGIEMTIPRKPVNVSSRKVSTSSLNFDDFDSTRRL